MKKLLVALLLISQCAFAGAIFEEGCPGKAVANPGTTNVLTITVPAGFAGGGLLTYCIYANNAANQPIASCTNRSVAIVNHVGGSTPGINAVLGTVSATAEVSPGTPTISVAIAQTSSGNVMTVNATPTITNYTPVAGSVIVSIHAIMPSVGDLTLRCL